MSQSRLESSFEAGAVKFDVAESDYFVMKHEGVSCYEKLFYRFPTREDLEKFMENVLHSRAAYRDSGGEIRVYNKRNPDHGTPGRLRTMLPVSGRCGPSEVLSASPRSMI